MERENYKEEWFQTPPDAETVLEHLNGYTHLDNTKTEGVYTPHGFVRVRRVKHWPPSTAYEMVSNGQICRRAYENVYHETEMLVHIAFEFSEEITKDKSS